MVSPAAPAFRASDSPPGRVCSYSRPVAFSQSTSACQNSALNRHTQLADEGAQGSSQTRSGLVSRIAAVTSAATSVSGWAQRRRSTASSQASAAVRRPRRPR